MNYSDIIPDENTALEAWLYYWLENYIRPVVKPSTYEHYRVNCETHIIPALGKIALKDITAKALQQFFNTQAKTGNIITGGPLSAKSMRNMRVVVDVAMKQALAEDLIPSNPVPLTVVKGCKTVRPEVMTDDMQEVLEKYLFENQNRFHPAILMALYTGLRRGELCALRWRNYDESMARLTVVETVRRLTDFDAGSGKRKTKLVFNDVKTNASARVLTMPIVLQELLMEQKQRFAATFGRLPTKDDFILFSSTSGVMEPDNLQHYFAKLLKQLGLEHVKFHAIRHTFATRTIESGVDVSTVSGILGHADVTTTTRFYVHPRDKAMQQAMSTITPIYHKPIEQEKKAS